MKKLKAFTLVELIVAIAIFGIIMAGIMQMISPINENATAAKVMNNQQNVENSITTFIGERVRYSTNLLIVEEGSQVGSIPDVDSAEKAIDAFFAFGPVNSKGRLINNDANRKLVNVICFDGETAYQYGGKDYTGRLISSLEVRDAKNPPSGRNAALDFSSGSLKPDGTKPQYMVFGNDYYGQSKCYLTIRVSGSTLKLRTSSNYYYSKSQTRFSDDSNNPTVGTYELRNMGQKSGNNIPYVFKYVVKSGSSGVANQGTSTKFYFVYTIDADNMANDPAPTAANPTVSKDGTTLT